VTTSSDAPAQPAQTPRGQAFRDILHGLIRTEHVRGGAIVAADGFVITSELPKETGVEALAALTATLGRELEVGAARLGRGEVQTAVFAAEDGTLAVGATHVGFLVIIGDRELNHANARTAMRKAVAAIHEGWGVENPGVG
jgi:predicted regulator of Ras-like GTPase activity (Roadblock/LC7/MglB family)